MLRDRTDYGQDTRIYAVATYSWGIPCPREGRLLDLRGRSSDGPG